MAALQASFYFDAFETFYLYPIPPVERVHVRDAMDLKRTMSVVILAVLPAFLFGIWIPDISTLLFLEGFKLLAECDSRFDKSITYSSSFLCHRSWN